MDRPAAKTQNVRRGPRPRGLELLFAAAILVVVSLGISELVRKGGSDDGSDVDPEIGSSEAAPGRVLGDAKKSGVAVLTRSLDAAMRAVREIRTGTVNVNEVPGYRIESSPFGGVKDSGLGIKEGVTEAVKYMTNVKTFSLPW